MYNAEDFNRLEILSVEELRAEIKSAEELYEGYSHYFFCESEEDQIVWERGSVTQGELNTAYFNIHKIEGYIRKATDILTGIEEEYNRRKEVKGLRLMRKIKVLSL